MRCFYEYSSCIIVFGYAREEPKNTVAGVHLIDGAGADRQEIDVTSSSDREAERFQDDTFERTVSRRVRNDATVDATVNARNNDVKAPPVCGARVVATDLLLARVATMRPAFNRHLRPGGY